ncbi:osmoprotectant NAGGN system M42 family peptidase [Desulforhopalus singaporensis]|uniref:Hydrolase, peptidase M42 family n=1 Tax=Desulforhopalus singaporensis TaxID=91360 RepID=A0A1H0VQT1_9BACT|nr:osmoprotectant NAGGN system M42 family peptidase [Desulforhopalus singaporensis]SDP80867.1 hydrolase, peptidase M42 family [Desulforhopalus singaporensis]
MSRIIMENSVNQEYLLDVLQRLLEIPSPSGMTDDIVRCVCNELDALEVPYELTRRGAIRATLKGVNHKPRRAVVTHLDTLGGMVKSLKRNGRLSLVPIGTWSSRFAEGARVRIHSDGNKTTTGTILPLKASGHTYNEEVDSQPVGWENLEVRLDEPGSSIDGLWEKGIRVGDYISFYPQVELCKSGYVNSRFLDDKAGVATILAAVHAMKYNNVKPSLNSSLLFTISEEIGVGASHVLRGNVAEMVSVDNGTIAPGQNTSEFGVTVAMMDSSGPYDIHLTRHLIDICMQEGIEFSRDVFLHYRSDAAAALEAGNDIRTALICFGLDASHGYERTHIVSLASVANLVVEYLKSPPLFEDDMNVIGLEKKYPRIKTSSELKPV